jgi:hypothetical protein
MKAIIVVLFIILSLVSVSFAQDTHVQGYYRQDGTYVQPHYRTHQDNTPLNNYGQQGNVNPYTGQRGYDVQPQPFQQAPIGPMNLYPGRGR